MINYNNKILLKIEFYFIKFIFININYKYYINYCFKKFKYSRKPFA